MARKPAKIVKKSGCPAWEQSNATYLVGRAAIDGADALALECERTWGAGRLRLLVTTSSGRASMRSG